MAQNLKVTPTVSFTHTNNTGAPVSHQSVSQWLRRPSTRATPTPPQAPSKGRSLQPTGDIHTAARFVVVVCVVGPW